MELQNETRPFGIRDKIGYLFGDLGNDFTFILSSSFLLKFYTDAVGVDASVVGIIMMLARFFDAFTDLTMGRICDRRQGGEDGKFRPWIRIATVPCALASFLIYQSGIASWQPWAKTLWLAITYFLWGSVFYTMVNIPYGSMASAISPDAGDRQSLSTFRTMGSTLAGAVIGVLVPIIAYEQKEIGGEVLAVLSGPRFTIIAGAFSILAVICHFVCYFLVRERVKIESSVREGRGILDALTSAVKNRALVSIIVASIVTLLSQMTMQQMANYLFPDYYGSPSAQSVSTLVMLFGMIIAAAMAKPLALRFGKAEISAAASLFSGGVSLLLFFLRPQNVWIYVAFSFASWLGLGIFSMVSWALITDVIDYSERKNGVREDATVYSLYSFARKLGQGGAAGLSGGLLTLIGYNKVAGGPLPESVREGIFTISTLLPAIGFIALALILIFWYPLKKNKLN